MTAFSAYAPPPTRPNMRSPTVRPVTLEPTLSISPASSSPRMSDSPTGGGYWPCRCNVSARFSAVARTRTSTCSGEGSGSGTCRSVKTSGPPALSKIMACMSQSPVSFYLPLNVAFRFSTKAVIPSAKSGVLVDNVIDRASLWSCS